MAAKIIDGVRVAARIRDGCRKHVTALATGGVGPMTVTMLLANTIGCAERLAIRLKSSAVEMAAA